MDFQSILFPNKTIAVVGVSADKNKYGNIVFNFLRQHGFEVYPVNPKYPEVEGQKCYRSLEDLPTKPDIVNIITPPNVSIEIVKQAQEMEIPYKWLQPGAESQEIIEITKQDNSIICGHCIMVEVGRLE